MFALNMNTLSIFVNLGDNVNLDDKDFDNIEIDWYCKGGITIDQLANQFE